MKKIRWQYIARMTFASDKRIDEMHIRHCTVSPDEEGYFDRSRFVFRGRLLSIASYHLRNKGHLLDRLAWCLWKFSVLYYIVMMFIPLSSSLISGRPNLLVFYILFPFPIIAWVYWGFRIVLFRRQIIAKHLCFNCGYIVHGTKTDQDGFGRCPECGRRFNEAEYREPPRGYLSLRLVQRDKERDEAEFMKSYERLTPEHFAEAESDLTKD